MTQPPLEQPVNQSSQPGRAPGRPRASTATTSGKSTEEHVLDEAKRLFMQYGYSAVSVSMIVEASGVTKPTLYHYFQDKEALYTQVLIRMMNRATEFIQPVVESDDSLRNKLVSLFTGFFANSPTTLTALLRDFAENIHNQPVQAVMTAYMTAIVEPFEAIFRQSLPSETSPDKVRMMAQMVISLLDAFTLQIRMEHGRCFDYQAKAEEAVDILMEGFAKTLTN